MEEQGGGPVSFFVLQFCSSDLGSGLLRGASSVVGFVSWGFGSQLRARVQGAGGLQQGTVLVFRFLLVVCFLWTLPTSDRELQWKGRSARTAKCQKQMTEVFFLFFCAVSSCVGFD